jgi:septal ring factor EnvC (AmiA/AmiB activator)
VVLSKEREKERDEERERQRGREKDRERERESEKEKGLETIYPSGTYYLFPVNGSFGCEFGNGFMH